jgi:ureidoglycolate dehydrogenase (NAD+)
MNKEASGEDNIVRVDAEAFSKAGLRLLSDLGVDEYCANHTIKGLVYASLRGIDSHGVRLFPHYLAELRAGRINRIPRFKFTRSASAVSLLDADHAFGIPAGVKAMKECVKLARENGVSVVSVRNSSHCATLSYFTSIAAEAGMIGLAMTGATPKLATPNAKKSFFGTNPICLVAPADGDDAICFDSALSFYTGNRVKLYNTLGKKLPEGVCVDSEGRPTQESDQAVKMVPIGGYKGWGLAMMVDILANMLAGMPSAQDVSVMYSDDLSGHRHLGHFVLALDPSKFSCGHQFVEQVGMLIRNLKTEIQFDGSSSVVIPGQPEKESHLERMRIGIPLPVKIYREFSAIFSDSCIEVNLVI